MASALQYKDLLTTAREEAEMRYQRKGLSGRKRSRFVDEDDSDKLGASLVPKRSSKYNDVADSLLEDDFLTETFNRIYDESKDLSLLKLKEEATDLPTGEAVGLKILEEGEANSTADFIASFENSRKKSYKAYKDGPQYSIGFGTKAKSADEIITYEEAVNRLNVETKKFESQVNKINDKHGYNWNDNQVRALTSFAFNNGTGGLNNLIEGGTRGNEEISMMMLEYNKVGNKVNDGLTKRRKAELDLFTK